jgi:hypothetical protein
MDTWKIEQAIGIELFPQMAAAVPNWLMLTGNHTAQLIKLLGEQFDIEDIIRLFDRPTGWKATDYYYCIVGEGLPRDRQWRITHPRNISVLHGRIPQRLCSKYGMNVAAGHGHLQGMIPAEGGKWLAVDIGICADPMRLDYAAKRDTTRPAMNQGALILKFNGQGFYPYLLSPQWSDWAALRRMYKREI